MFYLGISIIFATVIQAKNPAPSSFPTNLQNKENWPCPLAEDIAPCTYSYRDSRIDIECQNVVELSEIERIFSKPFPFPNMGKTARYKTKCFVEKDEYF